MLRGSGLRGGFGSESVSTPNPVSDVYGESLTLTSTPRELGLSQGYIAYRGYVLKFL